MAKADNPKKSADSGKTSGDPKLVDQVKELKTLTLGYARQEVLGPLKSLQKYLLWGISGAIFIGLGSVIVLIGVLRVLQTQTGSTFHGNWSFAPYLLTVIVGLVIIGLCVMGILGRSEKGK